MLTDRELLSADRSFRVIALTASASNDRTDSGRDTLNDAERKVAVDRALSDNRLEAGEVLKQSEDFMNVDPSHRDFRITDSHFLAEGSDVCQ